MCLDAAFRTIHRPRRLRHVEPFPGTQQGTPAVGAAASVSARSQAPPACAGRTSAGPDRCGHDPAGSPADLSSVSSSGVSHHASAGARACAGASPECGSEARCETTGTPLGLGTAGVVSGSSPAWRPARYRAPLPVTRGQACRHSARRSTPARNRSRACLTSSVCLLSKWDHCHRWPRTARRARAPSRGTCAGLFSVARHRPVQQQVFRRLDIPLYNVPGGAAVDRGDGVPDVLTSRRPR